MVNISWGNLLQIVYSIISYMKCDKKKLNREWDGIQCHSIHVFGLSLSDTALSFFFYYD